MSIISLTDFDFFILLSGVIFLAFLMQMILKRLPAAAARAHKLILLAASLLIVYSYDWKFLVYLLLTSLGVYGAGLLIRRASGEKGKKAVALCAIVLLCLSLGYCKYTNFFMSSLYSMVGKQWNSIALFLPVGISFYTFSAIGYLLDVMRENMEPERNFLDMTLFMSFFPKLVCGPIVRAKDFLPQLKSNPGMTAQNFSEGIQILAFGMFKKVVLADHLGVFVNDVYGNAAAFSTGTIWLAVFSYTLQLYFDFSGYTDMAIGIAEIFGYTLPKNFNLPYVAQNVSEYWNRWHISLTKWLNDYIYNPTALSMKRRLVKYPKKKFLKELPTYCAILLTFLVSGIWHGAGGQFIVWGLSYAVYSILHEKYSLWMKKNHREFTKNKPAAIRFLNVLLTFFAVNLIQVLFRADSLAQAGQIYQGMFLFRGGIVQPYTWTFLSYGILIGATLAAFVRSKQKKLKNIEGFYPIQDLTTVRGLTLFFLLCGSIFLLGYFGETFFIYANF